MSSVYKRNAGLIAFLLSGICAMSTGIVVSWLQDKYGFSYSASGTLIMMMNLGNILSGFAIGLLPRAMGMKKSVLLMGLGYFLGYLLMGVNSRVAFLMVCFLLVGFAKGTGLNTCTLLVGNNSSNRTIGMNILHSCYAVGALSCPFIIVLSGDYCLIVLGIVGFVMWLVFLNTNMQDLDIPTKKKSGSYEFFKSKKFWLLTALIFCQNAAETGVTSWLVSYFKNSGILSGTLSNYTITVMWFSTLIGRLFIAFVLKPKNPAKAMCFMSLGCIVFYIVLMQLHTQMLAIIILFAFSLSIAGLNPTAVSLAGSMTSAQSLAVMLPCASLGALLMPYAIGLVAEAFGIWMGMLTNVLPCIGLLIFSLLVFFQKKENEF